MEIKCLKCGKIITSMREQTVWCECRSTGIDELDYNLVRILGDDWERINKFDMMLVLPENKKIDIMKNEQQKKHIEEKMKINKENGK